MSGRVGESKRGEGGGGVMGGVRSREDEGPRGPEYLIAEAYKNELCSTVKALAALTDSGHPGPPLAGTAQRVAHRLPRPSPYTPLDGPPRSILDEQLGAHAPSEPRRAALSGPSERTLRV